MFPKIFFKIVKRRRRVYKTRRGKFVRKVRTNSNGEFLIHKNRALELATTRLEYFNQFYNFKYNKVTIRNQISRWGSCSKRGNLSFNYRIALLSPPLSDYIIVHELCHIGEFNHSKDFWNLVERTIPNWPSLREELKHKSRLVIKS